MKIVFACVHIQRSSRAVPLGAASVASNIKKHFPDDMEIVIENLYLTDTLEIHIKSIKQHQPDILGLSIYLWNRIESLKIIERIHTALPECRVIVGGPEPSARPDFYTENPDINHVLEGESEELIIPLVNQLLDSSSETPTITPQSLGKASPNLEKLPSPYLDGTLPMEDYTGVLWELSRGCPFRCYFCFESRGHAGIRRFAESRILAELDHFIRSGVSEIFILDPTFNYDKEQAKHLLGILAEKAPDIHYSMEIRAEFLDEELSELFSDIFCTLQIGLQSIHKKVLKSINRSFNQQVFTEKVYLLHEVQVAYGFDLIYGLPQDTLPGFLESLDYTFSLAPNHLDIFPLAILPGTELFDLADSYNIQYSEENSWIVTSTPDYSENDMKKSQQIADAVDLFYNMGKAVSWFDIVLPETLKPSEFFAMAAEFQPQDTETIDPLQFQVEVVTHIFNKLGSPELIELAIDIMQYFWVTNNLFQEGPINGLADGQVVNNSLSLAEFSHNPLDIVNICEQGVNQLADIKDICTYEKIYLACYIAESEFAVYFASKTEYKFLQAALSGNSERSLSYRENPKNRESIENMVKAGLLL